MLSALEAIELSICSIFKIAIRELRLGKEIVMNAVCSLGKGILDTVFWKKDKGHHNDEQTTPLLHFLLPLAGILLLWRKRDILSRILVKIDRSLSILCPSLSKSQRFLKWASNQLPPTWSSQLATLSGGLAELWRDGSLLCALINSAIPGACPNPHRHWRKPPLHAQTIAFKYLAIPPVFTENDFFDDNEATTLNVPQEQKFINYLLALQHAIVKLNNKTEIHSETCCANYIARGMGLVTGTQNKNTVFYLYSTSKSSFTKDVIVTIRGPYSSYATVTVPAFRNSCLKSINNRKNLIFESKQRKSFLKSISMDLMGGEKMEENVIPVKIEMESDRAVVGFMPKYTGMYQIVLLSNNEHLAGSPYNLRVLKDDCEESGCKTHVKKDKRIDYDDFWEKTKKIIIPHTGYRFNNHNNLKIVETKIREIKENFTDFDKQNNASDLHLTLSSKSVEKFDFKLSEKKQIFETQSTVNLKNKQKNDTSLAENKTKDSETSPERIISPICGKHIVSEVKSGDEFLKLSKLSTANENLVEHQNEIIKPPKNIKAFIKTKKDYWDQLILTNMLNAEYGVKIKENRISKSMECLNKKCDFDFSLDKSVDLVEIPSVRERKSVLIEHLTDEQKLLQMQQEKKKLKVFDEKRKPKRCESFQSVFNNENKALQPSFKSARNYFRNLEQNLLTNSLNRKNNKFCSAKHTGEALSSDNFLYDDMIGNRKCPNRICMESFVFHLKYRKRTRKMLISLFDMDVKR